MKRLLSLGLVALAAAAGVCAARAQGVRAGLFFDDFSHADAAALMGAGWQLRTAPGHPGVPGATWSPEAIRLLADPERPGNRLLRLSARTDGRAEGTVQAQVCHARKLLHGTYAARVRFTDAPESGARGDPVIQTFYAAAPPRHDFDPQFSEVDWEYLPNGGWGSEKPRLYAVSWQTVRLEPWQAHNSAHEAPGSHAGWRVLVMQVSEGRVRHYLDGRLLITHAGRNVPVVPMGLAFNLWFSPGGLMAPSEQPRVYVQDVDWVLHQQGRLLAPAQVMAEVKRLRAAGKSFVDTIPPAVPELQQGCDF